MGRHKKRKRKPFLKLNKHQKGKNTIKYASRLNNNNIQDSISSSMFVVNPLTFLNNNQTIETNYTTATSNTSSNFISFATNDIVLIVGETDFNFARAMIRNMSIIDENQTNCKNSSSFVTTSIDTFEECVEKYGSDAQFNIALIKNQNGIVLHSVDYHQFHIHPSLKKYAKQCFTKIILNFSEIYFNNSTIAEISDVKNFIREFLHSCKEILHSKNGGIYILFERISFEHKWNIENIARFQCNLNCECVNEKLDINQLIYGYMNERKGENRKNIRLYKMWMKNESRNKRRKKRKWLPLRLKSETINNDRNNFENEIKSKSIHLSLDLKKNKKVPSNYSRKNRIKWSVDEKLKKKQLKEWGLKLRINRKNFAKRKVKWTKK